MLASTTKTLVKMQHSGCVGLVHHVLCNLWLIVVNAFWVLLLMTQSSINPFACLIAGAPGAYCQKEKMRKGIWGPRWILIRPSLTHNISSHCQVFPVLNTKLHVLEKASEFNKMLKISFLEGTYCWGYDKDFSNEKRNQINSSSDLILPWTAQCDFDPTKKIT